MIILLLIARPAISAARSVSHHGLRSLGLEPGESAVLLAATVRALAARPAAVEIGRLWAFANATGKRMTQSEALVDQIPVAPWTASGGVSGWLATDLRAWGRGSVISRRTVRTYEPTAEPAPLTASERTVRGDLRYAVGLSLANLPHGLEVDLAVENAFGPVRHTPYQLDGRPSFLVEPRSGSELSVTARWTP